MSEIVTSNEIMDQLAEPFEANEVKWKPQSVKGNRALAVCYIDSRLVMDRLDDVSGPAGWQDEYTILPDGSVVCRLSVKIGGEWISKTDVGSPSEQPDGGDRLKAAFSDALKRAAVKFGIGRYLYRLGHTWCDYDPAKRQFVSRPQLPKWALPSPKTVTKALPPEPYAEPPEEPPALPASPAPAPTAKPQGDDPKTKKPTNLHELYTALCMATPPGTANFKKYVMLCVEGMTRLTTAFHPDDLLNALAVFLKVPADIPWSSLHLAQVESGWNYCKQFVKRFADQTPAGKPDPK